MRVRNIYVSDHRHIAANAYKRLYILSPCFQLKTRLLQEHPKTKVTHTEWNPEIMWKYSFSFNFKSQIRLFKERGVHFSSFFIWLTSWLNVLLQFRKNSPFVFVNVLTTNQTCFRNWFDFNRRKKKHAERILRTTQKHGHMCKGRCYMDQIKIFWYCYRTVYAIFCWQSRSIYSVNGGPMRKRDSRISANNPIFIVSKLLMQIPR